MYQNNPRGLEELKDAVKPAMRRLPLSVCRRYCSRSRDTRGENVHRAKHTSYRNETCPRRDSERRSTTVKSPQTKYLSSDFQVITLFIFENHVILREDVQRTQVRGVRRTLSLISRPGGVTAARSAIHGRFWGLQRPIASTFFPCPPCPVV